MKNTNYFLTIILLLNTLFSFSQSEKESINDSWKFNREDISVVENLDYDDLFKEDDEM